VSAPSPAEALSALSCFAAPGRTVGLEPFERGLINDSWVARLEADGGERRYLLQRINQRVFRRPQQVIENQLRVTRHLAAGLGRDGATDEERSLPRLVPTNDGQAAHVDVAGESWRLITWVEGTRAIDTAPSEAEAYEAARAFGRYGRQLADLPAPPLHATIPGFHDTPARLAAFERVAREDPRGRAAATRDAIEALLDRRALAGALLDAVERGDIRERPVHNDAKLANVLFDAEAPVARCVVDLDTTMPGLAPHDFGDLVRSAASDSAEDEPELARVRLRTDLFAALARGFVAGGGDALSSAERALLVTGALVIVYEQALRFLGDHLAGDRYYRVARPGHNLDRARTQLRLLELLEASRSRLEQAVIAAGHGTARGPAG
jgi:Ser/Thr protein kinase RdoA (MazF antagonist)